MTLADRLAVMDRGEVRQVGSPTEIYEFPNSRFVASFIGSITSFDGRVTSVEGDLTRVEVAAFGTEITARTVPAAAIGREVTVALRPEKLAIARERPEGQNAIAGEIKDIAYFGKDSLYRVILPTGELIAVHGVNAKRAAAGRPDWYDKVWLSFDPSAAILLTE